DPNKKYPLILNIHGGPHSAYGFIFDHEFQWMAAKGYVVLYPNPRGSTSYGQEFGNIIQYHYPGDDYKDLMAGVDEVVKRGYVDASRMGVTGGSGGGLLTNWTITQTQRFKAAVAQRDIADWYGFWFTADFTLFTPTWFKKAPWEDPDRHGALPARDARALAIGRAVAPHRAAAAHRRLDGQVVAGEDELDLRAIGEIDATDHWRRPAAVGSGASDRLEGPPGRPLGQARRRHVQRREGCAQLPHRARRRHLLQAGRQGREELRGQRRLLAAEALRASGGLRPLHLGPGSRQGHAALPLFPGPAGRQAVDPLAQRRDHQADRRLA